MRSESLVHERVIGGEELQDRPVARDGQVVIRPMMYVALTYDHRLVDGSEAVTFLRRVNVLGAVKEPGVYPVDETMTIANVLALAGGTTSPDTNAATSGLLRAAQLRSGTYS